MIGQRFLVCIILSWLGGLFTAWAFASSSSGHFSLKTLFLPGVFQIASIVGLLGGSLVAPFVYFCLRDHNFIVVTPILYGIVTFATVLLSLISPKIGFYGASVIWVLTLLAIKFFIK